MKTPPPPPPCSPDVEHRTPSDSDFAGAGEAAGTIGARRRMQWTPPRLVGVVSNVLALPCNDSTPDGGGAKTSQHATSCSSGS